MIRSLPVIPGILSFKRLKIHALSNSSSIFLYLTRFRTDRRGVTEKDDGNVSFLI